MQYPAIRWKDFTPEQAAALDRAFKDLATQPNIFDGATRVNGNATITGTLAVTGSYSAASFTPTSAAPATPTANTLYTTNMVGAWAFFDGTSTAADVTGTYTRSGTTVTVTVTAHGQLINHEVYLDFTSGAATDGVFTVTSVADANTFTITHGTSGTTNGNVTIKRRTLTAGFNVANISNNVTDTTYSVNFIVPFASANYVAGGMGTAGQGSLVQAQSTTAFTAAKARIRTPVDNTDSSTATVTRVFFIGPQ